MSNFPPLFGAVKSESAVEIREDQAMQSPVNAPFSLVAFTVAVLEAEEMLAQKLGQFVRAYMGASAAR